MSAPIHLPTGRGECHHELEIAMLIGTTVRRVSSSQALTAVAGYGLALDLTLRGEQSRLKKNGHPWEVAKAFDGSCPLSEFVKLSATELADLRLSLQVNGERRQSGEVGDMLTPPAELISYISQHFTLLPGDVVLTGTPEGVAALNPGDSLSLVLGDVLTVRTQIAVS